jgi:hypothetical protein
MSDHIKIALSISQDDYDHGFDNRDVNYIYDDDRDS